MEINVEGVQITLTPEQLQQIAKKFKSEGVISDYLLEIIEAISEQTKPKHWTDRLFNQNECEYYSVESNNDTCFYTKRLSFIMDYRKPQHAFRTEEQAQLLADKFTLMVEMHNFAHAMNEGWVADWNFSGQWKYGIIFSVGDSYVTQRNSENEFVYGIAVKSEEIAEQMLKEFGERIEAVYNKQF